MNFKYTWLKVVDGTKTQTRRLIKGVNLTVDVHGTPGATDSPNFGLLGPIKVVTTETGRQLYEVGQVLAVQPGRGKPAVARIRITAIRREDVREISDADVEAEGFETRLDFFDVWCDMHDHSFHKQYLYNSDMGYEWNDYGLALRPAERYTAWALTFELVRANK